MPRFGHGEEEDESSFLNVRQFINQTFNSTIHTYSTDDYSRAIKIRNLWIGGSGLTLNVIALALLIATKNIKLSLKISLLSLICNDLMFLSALVLNCQFKSLPVTTSHPGCWPVLLVSFTSILISYLSVCQVALQNCVAVFYPLRCHHMVTPSKIAASSVGIWILGFLLGVGCIGVKFAEDLPCIAFIPLPISGLAVYASVCISCAMAVSAINLKIFHKIWSVHRTVAIAPESSHTIVPGINERSRPGVQVQNPLRLSPNTRPNALSRETESASYCSEWNTKKRSPEGKKANSEATSSVWSSHDIPIPHSKSTEIQDCGSPHRRITQTVVRQGAVYSEQNNTAGTSFAANQFDCSHPGPMYNGVDSSTRSHDLDGNGVELIMKQPDPDNSNLKVNSFLARNKHNDSGLSKTKIEILMDKNMRVQICKDSKSSGLNDSSLSDFTSSSSTSSRFKTALKSGNVSCHHESTMRRHGQLRVRNTLLILTFWSCLVTTPFLVSIALLISCEKAVRIEFAQSSIGIVLSSLVALNAGTNPILYAWRFVPWKNMYTKFRNSIRRRLC